MRMTDRLRSLFIALVAAATAIAGVADVFADSAFLGTSIHAPGADRDRTREDDSGTVEEVEEDNVEGQEDGDVHLLGSMAFAGLRPRDAAWTMPVARGRPVLPPTAVPLGRGPPAAG